MDASGEQKWYFDFVTLQSPFAMKVSHLPMAWAIWVTRLDLGISILSDAMVLQQIELVDLQKLQRLCVVFFMIWDPQWFDSLGHFLPSHRYAFCALASFLLSILMPFTSPFSPDHIFAPLGDPVGPCLRKEDPAREEREAASNCRSGERRSRAQGRKVLRSDLWWRREPAQVHWNIVQRRLWSQRFNTGEYRFCCCFHECFLFFVDLLYWMPAYEWRWYGDDFAVGFISMSFIWSFIFFALSIRR